MDQEKTSSGIEATHQMPQTTVKGEVPDGESKHVEEVRLAQVAEEEEHRASIWNTLRQNPKIIGIAMFANLGALMYGFDSLSLSLCLSMPAFDLQFGTRTGGVSLIPAYWQSLWNALAQVACMIGALCIGFFSDRFGRRVCFFISGIISAAGIAVIYTANTRGTFLAGKMVNGLALGMCLATGQSYVSEIAPLRIRGLLLSAYAFNLNLGLMVAASIGFSRITIMNSSSYKVFFAVGWVWPGLLLIFSWLVPESPYFLVRKGDKEKAYRSLQRISNKTADVSALLANIIQIDEHEKEVSAASRSLSVWECFRGTNWRRTRIILYCNGLPQMIGATFLANGPYFLVIAGMNPSNVGMLVEIGISFAIASSIITWFAMSVCGRRKIVLFATGLSFVFFVIMGIASCFPTSTKALWTIGIALQLTWWVLGPATGPSVSIAGEISQTRLRAKSQSVGFAFNYFYSTIWNVVVPYMFNPGEGDLGGKLGWIFAATSLIALVILYFELPETKDRSYHEINEMFEQKVPARKFRGWQSSIQAALGDKS